MKLFSRAKRLFVNSPASYPAGTCQVCGTDLKIGPYDHITCKNCHAPKLVALGNQRLFISHDAAFPVDWDKVPGMMRDGINLYWRFFNG